MRQLACALVLLAACRPDGGAATPQSTGEPCDLPRTQGPSQPCCTKYGIDACGASLFCAALDGRATATCYLEHSRLDSEECGEDRQCASRSCNPAQRKCRALPMTKCSAEVGC